MPAELALIILQIKLLQRATENIHDQIALEIHGEGGQFHLLNAKDSIRTSLTKTEALIRNLESAMENVILAAGEDS